MPQPILWHRPPTYHKGLIIVARRHGKIKGGFIVIPKDTIKCQAYRQLSNTTRLVYQAFLVEFIRDTRTNPLNVVCITHRQLEFYSGVSHGSVVLGVRMLKNMGFVRVLKQGGLERNQSEYQLNGRYTQSGIDEAYW